MTVPRWSRKALVWVGPTLLALAINEVFFNPPLLSRADISPLQGTWTTGVTQIDIAPDGRVTGDIRGRVEANRTWFGKKLRLRSDYRIVGVRNDLKPVSVPFDLVDGTISAWLFVGPEYKANGPTKMRLARAAP